MLAVGQNEAERIEFVFNAIREHQGSEEYKTAKDAELYYKHQNPTIMSYQKHVYDQFGRSVPDIWSPNNKIASNWFNYFVTQGVSYLLGNGVSFSKDETKQKLGADFDHEVEQMAVFAKNGGVSFGFWNLDHVEVFPLTEFVPLYDEMTGDLAAGVRFWQLGAEKPLRATLYEANGYTEYIKKDGNQPQMLEEKRSYKVKTRRTAAEGRIAVAEENYDRLPIIPMWNINKQSELVGTRGTIDAYDLMISGLVNNVSAGEFLYWVLKNCDGMSDADISRFIGQMVTSHFAKADNTDEGSSIEAHKAEAPFQASAEALDRLERQLYIDFMALRVSDISSGNRTATEIQAAYEPLNQKTDQFEFCVTEFVKGILRVAGIDDEPSYTRSQLSNRSETLEAVLQAAQYLDEEYITQKILTVLGDADKLEDVLRRKLEENAARYSITEVIEA